MTDYIFFIHICVIISLYISWFKNRKLLKSTFSSWMSFSSRLACIFSSLVTSVFHIYPMWHRFINIQQFLSIEDVNYHAAIDWLSIKRANFIIVITLANNNEVLQTNTCVVIWYIWEKKYSFVIMAFVNVKICCVYSSLQTFILAIVVAKAKRGLLDAGPWLQQRSNVQHNGNRF